MAFERSLEIERRLETALHLIKTGRYSTPRLAEAIGVSIPTVSRIVAALRNRGHEIQAERTEAGWRYLISVDESPVGQGTRILTTEKGRRPAHHAD